MLLRHLVLERTLNESLETTGFLTTCQISTFINQIPHSIDTVVDVKICVV